VAYVNDSVTQHKTENLVHWLARHFAFYSLGVFFLGKPAKREKKKNENHKRESPSAKKLM